MPGNPLRYLVCLLMVISLGVFCFPADKGAKAGPGQQIFTTWQVFEVDKCASIWLIKRFIDQDAVIKIIPRGEDPAEGIPFDLPDAKFRRYFNMSTYESLLQHYNLTDAKLVKIGKIVNDIEINTWERKKYPESRKILDAINAIIFNTKDSDVIIAESIRYFDALYEKIEP